jgi:hypothetical protein
MLRTSWTSASPIAGLVAASILIPLVLGIAALAPATATAAPARFTYEVCDSALPGGGTPGVRFVANPGSPFSGINNCASPGGSIAIQETANGEQELAWWVVPVAATPGGFVESMAISAEACDLGPQNDHTWVYEHEPNWPANNCSESQRLFHLRSAPSAYFPNSEFDIFMNCDIGPCAPGPTILAHYIAATEVDPNAPTVSAPSGSLLAGGPIRGHQTIAAKLSDKGGGLAEAAVFVNGVLAGQAKTETCSVVSVHNPSVIGQVATSTSPCPKEDSFEWTLDTESYPFHDGSNSVAVCGFDFSTLDSPNRGCSAPQLVNVDNSCTPAAVNGGELLSAQFAASHEDTVTVGFGKGAEISGRLETNAGDPVPGAALCIKMATIGVDPSAQTVASVVTGAEGTYEYKVDPGPDRRIVIGYRYDSRQVARDVRYYAHVAPTLKSSPPVLRNGESVHLWGRLPGPRAGRRVVVMQANAPGSRRWITFRRATSNAKGAFRSDYRFTSTTRRTRYRFRALVPSQAGYPWVQGHSKPVSVLVTPARGR